MVQVEECDDDENVDQGAAEDEEDEVELPEGVQAFLDFNWSDDKWQKYLEGLYPPPNPRQLLKYKKKWYKRNIDPDFDDNHPAVMPPPEPRKTADAATAAAAAAASQEGGYSSGGSSGSADSGSGSAGGKKVFVPNPFVTAAGNDGSRWAVMGQKTTICCGAYAFSMTAAIAAAVDVLPAYQALILLIASFALEILAKYGIKLKTEWMHSILLDDVGVMPMMVLTLLTPGMHFIIRLLALAVPFLTALMSFAQICKHHPKLPPIVQDFFAPLTDKNARYQVMDLRAKVELALGIALVIGVIMMRAAPFSGLLFWNFMMMRYMMSPWTQEAFRQLDAYVSPRIHPVYPLRRGYRGLKKFLYSFVDPEKRKKGGMSCTIL
eukprot:CAMPEP_0178386830 /NCGR_PEP_ID=MMETSP0689_2-20121128/8763_1 /TAXON_ID=160604 /ORGANISM="Amphidinium massartii, Strain CS-259" /LENGTH=377 /DNA_ID=CAMNT_0020007181 /DNA_START=29 /DNA_END=1163 /DNA_ORIENTATION=+